MKQRFKINVILFSMVFLTGLVGTAQTQKQRELEERKQEILKEIKQINSLLYKNRKKEKNIITQVEDVNYKVNIRKNLIKITNQQVNYLTREINRNQNEISRMRDELKVLKKRYADMIVKSYKSKNENSKVMFLLSSDNFQQAYKRLQYIKQNADYQKKQGLLIQQKTQELQNINKQLLAQKADKQHLIAENKQAQEQLEKELKQQEVLMASVKKSLSKYAAQIKDKQREADRIDREIEKIIRAAIASSNKKAGKSSTTGGFALTPAAKALAANFVSNKGKLPWPVEKGIVKLRYGVQPSSIDRTISIKSNGVRIATEEHAPVKAIFNGEVSGIILIKNANPIILIRHGNYLTAYKNLSKIFVKKGDKIDTGQVIGEVFTNSRTGESLLGFSLYKNDKPLNPAEWIYKM